MLAVSPPPSPATRFEQLLGMPSTTQHQPTNATTSVRERSQHHNATDRSYQPRQPHDGGQGPASGSSSSHQSPTGSPRRQPLPLLGHMSSSSSSVASASSSHSSSGSSNLHASRATISATALNPNANPSQTTNNVNSSSGASSPSGSTVQPPRPAQIQRLHAQGSSAASLVASPQSVSNLGTSNVASLSNNSSNSSLPFLPTGPTSTSSNYTTTAPTPLSNSSLFYGNSSSASSSPQHSTYTSASKVEPLVYARANSTSPHPPPSTSSSPKPARSSFSTANASAPPLRPLFSFHSSANSFNPPTTTSSLLYSPPPSSLSNAVFTSPRATSPDSMSQASMSQASSNAASIAYQMANGNPVYQGTHMSKNNSNGSSSANSPQPFRAIGSTSSIASSSLAPSQNSLAVSASRQSSYTSRRPSMATVQSFLEGVNHVTRVRSPSLRGHSRAGSLDGSVSDLSEISNGRRRSFGEDNLYSPIGRFASSGTPWHHLDDMDEVPSWEENQSMLLTPNSPTPRRNFAFYSRNPSAISLRRHELFKNENEPSSLQASPMPIGRKNARYENDELDDDDEFAEKTFVDRRDPTLFPHHMDENGQDLAERESGLRFNPDNEVNDYDEMKHLQNLEESVWSEKDLNTLQEGDRLGIGLKHEGHVIVDALENSPESPFQMPDDGIQFEIVRQLGYGSYAIVYLVREVLYDNTHENGMMDDIEQTPFQHDEEMVDQSDEHSNKVVYGREFALKCLSKSNLTEEQMAVQKFEVTLHRALPNHINVVSMHKAMETPLWLFLVLEYCPGQDLFFWLEQARDSEVIEGDISRAPSRLSSRAPLSKELINRAWPGSSGPSAVYPPLGESPYFMSSSFEEKEHTPPSPSLLAATVDTALLARRRLRLISRMFGQMCEGLQMCHNAGVSHRDIKPENIIIVDSRAELGSSGKVIIKITDWGLGTTDERCEDFDCGSKPYMAYECRNNLTPSYDPKGADVWSLGIVLLNLLFHRCPWADPTLDDPDFSEFKRKPVQFLETRFEGIGREVATFLATRVFCDVADQDSTPTPAYNNTFTTGVRVSAGEFGKWANQLVRWMGDGKRRASISESTFQMVSQVKQSPQHGGPRPFNPPPHRSPRNSFLNNTDEPSPSRKNFKHTGLPNDLVEELEAQAEMEESRFKGRELFPPSPSEQVFGLDAAIQSLDIGDGQEKQESVGDLQSPLRDAIPSQPLGNGTLSEHEHEEDHEHEQAPDGETEQDPEAIAAAKSRRRKRGARKGKSHRPHGSSHLSPTSDATSPDGLPPTSIDLGASRSPVPVDPELSVVSEHLQSYAREISQATKPSVLSPTPAEAAAIKTKGSKSRFADRLKGAFANGNPDLQAFTARARERELALTGGALGNRNPTTSAPAKMQHSGAFSGTGSGISSFGSVASTGSWSEDGATNGHWASTGSRRERLDRHKRTEDSSPLGNSSTHQSKTRTGRSSRHHQSTRSNDLASTVSSSPSRQSSYTPLSSFSSTTSYESRSPAANRPLRSALSSINETVHKADSLSLYEQQQCVRETPSAESASPVLSLSDSAATLTRPTALLTQSSPAVPTAARAIREPTLPPPQPDSPATATVAQAASTQAPKAKFGRLLNKFSRN